MGPPSLAKSFVCNHQLHVFVAKSLEKLADSLGVFDFRSISPHFVGL